MFETVVCGVDASDAAGPVADVARWLADGLGAKLIALHVVEEPVEAAEELPAALRARLGLDGDDEVRLVEGSPAPRLLEAADEVGAGLIVVGSRGRGSLRSAVLGSVSRTLSTSAHCPVVVVPEGAAVGSGAGEPSIVCGTDGSDHALAATRLAGRLAERLGYRLIVVHALPDLKAVASYPGARSTSPPLSGQPDARRRLAEEILDRAAAAAAVDAECVLEEGRPWEALTSVAGREDGRVLVVAARGLSALQATLFGSVASQLATSAMLPVLILPEAAEASIG